MSEMTSSMLEPLRGDLVTVCFDTCSELIDSADGQPIWKTVTRHSVTTCKLSGFDSRGHASQIGRRPCASKPAKGHAHLNWGKNPAHVKWLSHRIAYGHPIACLGFSKGRLESKCSQRQRNQWDSAQSAPHVSLELMKSNSAGPFQASSFRFRHLPYPRIVLTGNIAFIHTRLQFLEFFNLRFQKSANTVQNWQAADSPPPSELERSKIQRYFMCSSLRQP